MIDKHMQVLPVQLCLPRVFSVLQFISRLYFLLVFRSVFPFYEYYIFLENECYIIYVHRYSQQQNKWYSKKFLLAHFEATFYLILANLLSHNYITINYNMQVNSQRLK